ncbi:hypothetical protein C8R46DRAFT_1238651 [Mycena filopes]|nr:hypothetical protein C8R46DRAFT_1238651 [Mycena filopes]
MKLFDWYVDKNGLMSRDRAFIRDDAELDPLGPTNSPILYAHTFKEAYELLAITKSLKDAWHLVGGKLEPAVPIYFIVDHSDRIITHWYGGFAFTTWYSVRNPWGTIYATTNLERARELAVHNRYLNANEKLADGVTFIAASEDDEFCVADVDAVVDAAPD